LTVVDTIFNNGSEATIDGHLTLNQNIRVGAVPTTSTNLNGVQALTVKQLAFNQ